MKMDDLGYPYFRKPPNGHEQFRSLMGSRHLAKQSYCSPALASPAAAPIVVEAPFPRFNSATTPAARNPYGKSARMQKKRLTVS